MLTPWLGAEAMRHLAVAAVGSPAIRRTMKSGTPDFSCRSFSRRLAVKPYSFSRAPSAITAAPRAGQLAASSAAQSRAFSVGAESRMTCSAARPS